MTKPYPDVSQSPSFSNIEESILARWKSDKTFEKSVDFRPSSSSGAKEYVFYDGPPFANGLPHYGHLLTGYVKDLVPRYWTMRGKRVDRRFGWDCHGLPAELEAEKGLNISGRQAIEEYGIEKFNSYCRDSVLKYTKDWEVYVTRQARWVSFENDYKTMDLSYMESVLWAFKELFKKGLVYEGYRVMPYSWAVETPLSNFEIRLDNSYRSKQDPAISVAFTLVPKDGDPLPLKILAWTTTPWTLPSNLAIAVGADIEYAIIEKNGSGYIVASPLKERFEAELGANQVGSLKGQELVERIYQPLFPYFKDHPDSFRILAGDFVSTEDGTGAVHMAPGFGEDDQRVSEAAGIKLVCPVDIKGRFSSEVTDYEGVHVFDANKLIIKRLKEDGSLIKHETIEHNYPHCWRTDTPIIYKAVESWYVAVTKFKDRMVELNQNINWIPEHIKDGQFGKWLENARDWSISRNRFWGTPIPIWKSDNPKFPRLDVYGSIEELQKDFGTEVKDLHRPFIDELTRPNPDDPSGNSTMRRVPEVFDCWFESGSMPFAQIHYPFENKEWFEKHFPADFIVEYVAQTRGWFYTLMVLGTALFDKPPFSNCICHGVVLDENGQKLSKRLQNYPSPEAMFDKYGADALRWFLVSSPILRGADLNIDRDGKCIGEVVRSVLNPIWNAYYFLTLYGNTDAIRGSEIFDSPDLLDKYILSKTGDLVRDVEAKMDNYDISAACFTIHQFLDALNNWYIRRSRDRFWKSDKDDSKVSAYNTLHTVLVTLSKIIAPFLPLISEEIYRGLTNEESVHLSDWPDASLFVRDDELVRQMDSVRDICSVALSLREANDLRTRLPLKSLTVAGKNSSAAKRFSDIIRDEINVKEVLLSDEFSSFATLNLSVNSRAVGPRLGNKMKDVLQAARNGQWQSNGDSINVGGETLSPEEFSLTLRPIDGVACDSLPDHSTVVVLDTELTDDLRNEGLARDLVRLIQQSRKEAALHVSDHIGLLIEVSGDFQAKISSHLQYIAEQTLADRLEFDSAEKSPFSQKLELGEFPIVIGIERIS